MKLTTKRNRWYFWRELFSYMIPMILIVWTIDVFRSFMICPLHPEWSTPCSVNWILAAIYGIPLLIVIILEILSAKMLRKVKKQIEKEFLETVSHNKESLDEKSKENVKVEAVEPKKMVVKTNKQESNKKSTKKESKKVTKTSTKKESSTKKKTVKK